MKRKCRRKSGKSVSTLLFLSVIPVDLVYLAHAMKKNFAEEENRRIDALFEKEAMQIGRLQEIVSQSIKDQDLLVENLLHPAEEVLTPGQSMADKVARFGGSWAFIISFLL